MLKAIHNIGNDTEINVAIGYFCNAIRFNAQIFVKCLITNHFIHLLRIFVFQ